jgi:hypothetical protein
MVLFPPTAQAVANFDKFQEMMDDGIINSFGLP